MEVSKSKLRQTVPVQRVVKLWWPLAASWFLVSVEGPLLNGVIARLLNPEINLAAYGGVVLPIALIIEAPIIMLLSASTAMCKDRASYHKLRKFMMLLSAGLTILHALIAFTPLYYFITQKVIGVPVEVVEPARIGLMLMLPWTWAIGYRRFQQGVMIRFGHSDGVMTSTFVRLSVLILVLGAGYLMGSVSGVIVGTAAQALGVTCEAIYSGFRVKPVLRRHLYLEPETELFTWREFSAFYIPLMLTSLLNFIVQPIGSAAVSRMPKAVESLAVWGVVSNLIFFTRSVGLAYNEVVVALFDEKGSSASLRKFSHILAFILSGVIILIAFTPLSMIWFRDIAALSPNLAEMARIVFMFVILVPATSVYQSWFQGAITSSRRTNAITESIIAFLSAFVVVLVGGVFWGKIPGLYFSAIGFAFANLARTFVLWLRSKPVLNQAEARDQDLDKTTLLLAGKD